MRLSDSTVDFFLEMPQVLIVRFSLHIQFADIRSQLRKIVVIFKLLQLVAVVLAGLVTIFLLVFTIVLMIVFLGDWNRGDNAHTFK